MASGSFRDTKRVPKLNSTQHSGNISRGTLSWNTFFKGSLTKNGNPVGTLISLAWIGRSDPDPDPRASGGISILETNQNEGMKKALLVGAPRNLYPEFCVEFGFEAPALIERNPSEK